ncbi:MAG: hypothetical protein RJQ09_20090 [Cyclobacteriaceae bacterium]
METGHLITAIISSSVIATLLSSLVNFYFRKEDFKNEYYKIVIQKRLKAYEWLETQIASLKSSVLDEEDGKPYHLIFGYGRESFMESIQQSMLANAHNLWLASKTNDLLTKLVHIFNKIPFEVDIDDSEALILTGKKYYRDIAELRTQLENSVREDILSLYSLSSIKRKRNNPKEYNVINVKRGGIARFRNKLQQQPPPS